MIKVSDKFSISRTKYNWELHEWVKAKDRDGNPKLRKYTSYYPTLEKTCKEIIDRTMGKCDSLEQIIELLSDAGSILEKTIMERHDVEKDA